MKQKWLNLILHLTGKIYNKKQELVMSSLMKAVNLALQIILLELLLFIISLPTYFFVEKSLALPKEDGKIEVISYRMRRKFIVSVIIITGFILFVLFAIQATIRVFFAPISAFS